MISFTVLGIPQTKGSTKAFMRPGMRYPVITNDNTKNKAWADGVKLVAQQHAPAGGPWKGPVSLTLVFSLVRPTSLSRKVLHHVKKPDLDKLTRSIKDSLKGVIYYDDSQVMVLDCRKYYEDTMSPPGVQVSVEQHRAGVMTRTAGVRGAYVNEHDDG